MNALLTPNEFDRHILNNTLRLAFVGMSNCGKSYRAHILSEENDFLWYQVDDDIQKALGLTGQGTVAKWLGYPNDVDYRTREKKYLELENMFTDRAAMSSHGKNLVFDTTGSVVHLSRVVQENLSTHTLVVHFDVGEEFANEMLKRFFEEPKPLIWDEYYSQLPHEKIEDAIRRSYPDLLHERLMRYRALAHINIRALDFYNKNGTETLALIRNHL